jgi:hypothetical protein
MTDIPAQVLADWSVADLDWYCDWYGIGGWRESAQRAAKLMGERRVEREVAS